MNIEHAWRFPTARINEFLSTVNPLMFANALERVRILMRSVKRASVTRMVFNNYRVRETSRKYRKLAKLVRFEFVMQLAKYVADSRINRPLTDLECGVNVMFYGWHSYAIPYGCGYLYKNIKMPEWVESFPYWTHTDPPKNMRDRSGTKKWRKRGEIWEKVYADGTSSRGLKHEIVVLRRGLEFDSIERLRRAVFGDGR